MKTMIKVKEASEIMGVSPDTVRMLVEEGKIPKAVVVIGKRNTYYIPRKPFMEWLGEESGVEE